MDGTIHQQYGKKMEGVEWSYKNIEGLSSQNLFDDKGLCYGFALRNGAAHSSVGAVEMMEIKSPGEIQLSNSLILKNARLETSFILRRTSLWEGLFSELFLYEQKRKRSRPEIIILITTTRL